MRTDSEHSPAKVEHRPHPERTGTVTSVATLIPTQAPGRLTRKARHYLTQIAQLRAQGYTLEAIQQALADVGVSVSLSTVRREAMRPVPIAPWPVAAPVAAPAPLAVAPPTPPPGAPVSSVASPAIRSLPDASSGKDVAAAYAQSKSTNPLSRAKEKP